MWASELALMAEPYRERLNEAIGEDLVRTIRFTVTREVRDRKARSELERADEAFYAPRETGLADMDEEALEQVRRSAEAIHDPALREAAIRAVASNLRRKKAPRDDSGPEAPPE